MCLNVFFGHGQTAQVAANGSLLRRASFGSGLDLDAFRLSFDKVHGGVTGLIQRFSSLQIHTCHDRAVCNHLARQGGSSQ